VTCRSKSRARNPPPGIAAIPTPVRNPGQKIPRTENRTENTKNQTKNTETEDFGSLFGSSLARTKIVEVNSVLYLGLPKFPNLPNIPRRPGK
jgi:hypothetical protein